jgi:hypothetical protein
VSYIVTDGDSGVYAPLLDELNDVSNQPGYTIMMWVKVFGGTNFGEETQFVFDIP